MNKRFIKTFVGRDLQQMGNTATDLADREGLTIISAQLSFMSAGTISEQMVLTVVYERGENKQRKPRKKAEEIGDGVDGTDN
jgi:hypothetical protein